MLHRLSAFVHGSTSVTVCPRLFLFQLTVTQMGVYPSSGGHSRVHLPRLRPASLSLFLQKTRFEGLPRCVLLCFRVRDHLDYE